MVAAFRNRLPGSSDARQTSRDPAGTAGEPTLPELLTLLHSPSAAGLTAASTHTFQLARFQSVGTNAARRLAASASRRYTRLTGWPHRITPPLRTRPARPTSRNPGTGPDSSWIPVLRLVARVHDEYQVAGNRKGLVEPFPPALRTCADVRVARSYFTNSISR